MAEVPSKVPVAKSQPPLLHVKKAKDYSVADYDTPCIVIENASCETVLPMVKDGILGINRAGVMSILNGAVPPTQSWVRYVYRQQEQPVKYAEMYPNQAWLLAEINDMLLRHAMSSSVKSGPNIDYAQIKTNLKSKFRLGDEHFSDSLSLPTIRLTTPSFMSDPIVKYVWAMKVWQGKLNLKEEGFETMLEMLDAEESAKEGKTVEYVTEMYDYSVFARGEPQK
jgi:hypothetical protein